MPPKCAEKESLDRLLLLIYGLKGSLPYDSVSEMACTCGYHGLMDIDPPTVVRKAAHLDFSFHCPQCGGGTAHRLRLPLRVRLKRLAYRLKRLGLLWRAHPRKILAMGMLALVIGAAATEYAARGFRLLVTAGPRAALAWVAEPRTDREKFVQAWSFYAEGRLVEARELVRSVLHSENVDRKTRADCLYLQGLLRDKQGAISALDTFQRAAAIYSDLGKVGNVHQVYIAIAKFLFTRDDIELAENYLDLALSMDLPPDSVHWGFYYETKTKIHFSRAEYAVALDTSYRGLEFYERIGNVNGQARCLSDAGFYLILLGNLEEGLRHTVDAEEIILETGDMDLFYFNKVNFYLHARCSNQNQKAYATILDEKIAESGDRLLEKFVEFVRNFPCAPVVIGDGQAPPPD